jgi:hypothetical protein
LGDVYDYDAGDFCHYTSYGTGFKIENEMPLESVVDYDLFLGILRAQAAEQDRQGFSSGIENLSFISKQALNDIAAGKQAEKVLGVDARTIHFYEMMKDSSQYYVIFENGTVELMTLPPDPEEKLDVFNRIFMGIAFAAGAVAGVLCCFIPGAGPFIGGALISASLDLFMQTAINGTKMENVDWGSVVINGVVGVLTAGAATAGVAAAKAGLNALKVPLNKFVAQLGVGVISGAVGNLAGYVGGTALRGGEITLEGCLTAAGTGALTGAVLVIAAKFIGAIGNFAKKILRVNNTDPEVARAISKVKAELRSPELKAIKKDLLIKNPELKAKIDNLAIEDIYFNSKGESITKVDLYLNANDPTYMNGVTGIKNGVKFELVNGTPKFTTDTINSNAVGSASDENFVNGLKDAKGEFGKSAARKKIMDMADDNFAREMVNLAKNKQLTKIPQQLKDYCAKSNIKLTEINKDIIKKFRSDMKFTWHEYIELNGDYMVQLVPTKVHNSIRHAGGMHDLVQIMKKMFVKVKS